MQPFACRLSEGRRHNHPRQKEQNAGCWQIGCRLDCVRDLAPRSRSPNCWHCVAQDQSNCEKSCAAQNNRWKLAANSGSPVLDERRTY
jgi:hypothetical protein